MTHQHSGSIMSPDVEISGLMTSPAVPQGCNGVRLSQLDDDCSRAQLMARVAGVPVVVARVAVEQGVSATAHTLDDAGTGRDGRHVLTGHCRHWRLGYRLFIFKFFRNISGSADFLFCLSFCSLPKRPLSRVKERLVNMHSKATRWKTLLTVLCVPTMRTYLRHKEQRQMLVSRKTKQQQANH